MMIHTQQHTVGRAVSCAGVGVHSGKPVRLTIMPAPVNHGIKFVRADLAGRPTGLSIDNAVVELDSHEIPIMDGSAGPFTEMILSAGIVHQPGPRCFFVIKKPIEIEENGKSVGAYPMEDFRLTYTIEYDHPLIRTQTLVFDGSREAFRNDICKARTYGFLHEYEYLKQYGLAQGCSLDNVIVIDRDQVVNDDGLRFEDEFVRHKLLDCIGDLSLLGMPIIGEVIVSKSGHAFNHAFIKKFFTERDAWETRTLHNGEVALPVKSLAI
jgi:UDP-3-O-[3-hydroxymyristoyl] N-acetylglucosamine deacetylase